MTHSQTAIITGITGQDGSYLAKLLLEKSYKVIGLTRSYTNSNYKNLKHLGILDDIIIEECDLLDFSSIIKIFKQYRPSEIYNLAAQSSVGLSFEQPIGTINFNISSVLNVLETMRILDMGCKYYQASSCEMFGRVNNLPITEETQLHPLSPYAISKASAYWIVKNYRESYNVFGVNGILFNHESYLRSHNFFVKKVIFTAIEIKHNKQQELRVGNIDIKRDFGYAPEYVTAMWLSLQKEIADDYVICSGKSVLLRDIIYFIFDYLGIDKSTLIEDPALYRPSEIMDIYGDNTKALNNLNWNYNKSFFDILPILIQEELKNYT